MNINSLRNKFDNLVQQIANNIDVLTISEIKLPGGSVFNLGVQLTLLF